MEAEKNTKLCSGMQEIDEEEELEDEFMYAGLDNSIRRLICMKNNSFRQGLIAFFVIVGVLLLLV